MNQRIVLGLAVMAAVSACSRAPADPPITTLSTETADGITIYGEAFFGDLGAEAPLILLFHQGGSNGRGEYGALASWLNEAGFRAIAWDLRAGGDMLMRSIEPLQAYQQRRPQSFAKHTRTCWRL